MRTICLHIFRHIAQKFLDRRQPACKISIQSDEKSDGASCAQALCGVALNLIERKVPFNKFQPDVLKIKEALLEELAAELTTV